MISSAHTCMVPETAAKLIGLFQALTLGTGAGAMDAGWGMDICCRVDCATIGV